MFLTDGEDCLQWFCVKLWFIRNLEALIRTLPLGGLKKCLVLDIRFKSVQFHTREIPAPQILVMIGSDYNLRELRANVNSHYYQK